MAEIILPGTYIKVFDEGLISAGAVASGNIGIVGTAAKGPTAEVVILSSFSEAREVFGDVGGWDVNSQDNLTLVRSLELIFNNGGSTVYAVRVATKEATKAKVDLKKGSTKFLTLEAQTTGTYGNSIGVELMTSDGNVLEITDGQTTEKYEISSLSALEASINEKSRLVACTFSKEVDVDNIALTKLSGGKNGEKATTDTYKNGLALLEQDIINIVLLAGQDTSSASLLAAHLKMTGENQRERIAVIGAAKGSESNHNQNSGRLIVAAPGIKSTSIDSATRKETSVDLPAAYTAAAVAGLIASLPVQSSPTNKILAIAGLTDVYNTGKLEKLVQNRALAIEQKQGYRVVKGITTANTKLASDPVKMSLLGIFEWGYPRYMFTLIKSMLNTGLSTMATCTTPAICSARVAVTSSS